MALTKISRSLLDTGISDSSDATAITIDSSENILLSNTTSLIGVNTSDGSDNKSVMINGGGAASSSRGAYIWAKGNEHSSNPGFLQLTSGSVSGAAITAVTNGTERMRIDSSGNVGIGDSNPGAKLDVNSGTTNTLAHFHSTDDNAFIEIKDDDTTGYIGVQNDYLYIGGAPSTSTQNLVINDGTGNVGIGTTSPNTTLHTATGTNSSGLIDVARFVNLGQNVDDGARIQLTAGTSTSGAGIGCLGYALNSAHLVFHAGGNTERMRIDQAGALCIGTTGSGSATSINCLSTPSNANVGVARFGATGEAAATTAMCVVKSVNDNSTTNVFVRFGINGYAGGSGQINANGSSQAAFGTFSDRRLKENITDLPSQLDKIKAMRAVEFDYIESEGGGHQLGFIAQEIEEIYPDMVGEREDGMKTLSGLGKWEARLVKAIQEQQEQIEALQSEINLLKGE